MVMMVVMNIDEWHYWCVTANIREEMEFDYTITNELLSAMYVFQEAVSNVWVAYYRYSLQYGNLNLFSLHFNGNFSRWTWVFFFVKLRMMEVVVTAVQCSSQIVTINKPTPNFLQSGCPSCRPTGSVKALKGKGSWIHWL